MQCLMCQLSFNLGKQLSNHIKRDHELSSEQYTTQYLYKNQRPKCKTCGAETRYSAFKFKDFCKLHAREAMSIAGSIGGKAPAWNKGQTKATDERIRILAQKQLNSGNAFFGHKHSLETKRKISDVKTLGSSTVLERIVKRSNEFHLITDLIDYWSRQDQYLTFECVVCGTQQEKTLQAFERGSLCRTCFPFGQSQWEIDVLRWCERFDVRILPKNRSVIKPKEIDIYFPDHQFGIECNGLYYHSENSPDGIDSNAHLVKYRLCSEQNTRLFQIFEDEWLNPNKRIICENMIMSRLGLISTKIGARNLEIVELDTATEREFFNKNHLMGYIPSQHCFGLAKNNEIFAAISLKKPRQARKYEHTLEVARFASRIGIQVQGGLSRLVRCSAQFARSEGFTKILTYVDRRVGSGKSYEKAGFTLIGETGLDFWYTDNERRFHRLKFRAKAGKSEREVAAEAKVSRIYGCGSWIFAINI